MAEIINQVAVPPDPPEANYLKVYGLGDKLYVIDPDGDSAAVDNQHGTFCGRLTLTTGVPVTTAEFLPPTVTSILFPQARQWVKRSALLESSQPTPLFTQQEMLILEVFSPPTATSISFRVMQQWARR